MQQDGVLITGATNGAIRIWRTADDQPAEPRTLGRHDKRVYEALPQTATTLPLSHRAAYAAVFDLGPRLDEPHSPICNGSA